MAMINPIENALRQSRVVAGQLILAKNEIGEENWERCVARDYRASAVQVEYFLKLWQYQGFSIQIYQDRIVVSGLQKKFQKV